MGKSSLAGSANLSALPASLEGTVTIQFDGFELDVFSLVISLATVTKIVVRQVGRMPTETDDGGSEASITRMPSVDKVGAGTIGLSR